MKKWNLNLSIFPYIGRGEALDTTISHDSACEVALM